jgi:hypothetical protein
MLASRLLPPSTAAYPETMDEVLTQLQRRLRPVPPAGPLAAATELLRQQDVQKAGAPAGARV